MLELKDKNGNEIVFDDNYDNEIEITMLSDYTYHISREQIVKLIDYPGKQLEPVK